MALRLTPLVLAAVLRFSGGDVPPPTLERAPTELVVVDSSTRDTPSQDMSADQNDDDSDDTPVSPGVLTLVADEAPQPEPEAFPAAESFGTLEGVPTILFRPPTR